MGLTAFLGRVFLVIIFIGAGVSKFQNPKEAAGLLNARYPTFYKHIAEHAKTYNVPLPEQIAPKFIEANITTVIQVVGGLELVLGLFVLLNQAWAGKLLALLTISFIAVIHNPFLFGSNHTEKAQEQIFALQNLGIVGALLLVGGSSKAAAACPVTKPTKKSATAPAPSKKAAGGKKRD